MAVRCSNTSFNGSKEEITQFLNQVRKEAEEILTFMDTWSKDRLVVSEMILKLNNLSTLQDRQWREGEQVQFANKAIGSEVVEVGDYNQTAVKYAVELMKRGTPG